MPKDKFITMLKISEYDRLDLADMAFVDLPDKSEGIADPCPKQGDLLITITGANYVTKTAFVTSDIGTELTSGWSTVALRRRPVEGSNTEFLYWYLVSEAAGRKPIDGFSVRSRKAEDGVGINLENIRSAKYRHCLAL